MSDHLGLIISEVRYLTGINKAMHSYIDSIDPAKLEAINATITSQIRKSILSTALKYKQLTTGEKDVYIAKDNAQTIIDLFNHASRIPLHEQKKLENTCKGIGAIITAMTMVPKMKKVVKVKGDDKKSADEETEE